MLYKSNVGEKSKKLESAILKAIAFAMDCSVAGVA